MYPSWKRTSILALAVGVTCVGCRIDPAPDQQGDRAFSRMIIDPTEAIFDLETTREALPVSSLELVASKAGVWRANPADRVLFEDDGIEIVKGSGLVSISREVAWEAEGIDALRMLISRPNLTGRQPRFFWAGPGEQFSGPRSVAITESSPGELGASLVDHSEWHGQVSKIRIDISPPEMGETTVHSIQGLRYVYGEDDIASATNTNWKVEVDHDLRNSVVVAAGHPVVWRVDDLTGEELEFSVGFVGTGSGVLRFDVSSQNLRGEWESVFEADSRAASAEPDLGWREARIDMRSQGPIQAVKFEVVPEKQTQGFAGFGVVANPVVRTRRAEASTPNVLIISLDTLRADRLAMYGYHQTTSPNIDRWAKRSGVVFANTVASSPRTLPSHVSMLTGLDCLSHGVNHLVPAPLALETLAETLRNENYTTAAIVGGGLMNPNFGLAQGFDEFYHYPGWPGGFGELEVELDRALEKLSRLSDRPFFLLFHTYEIHDPFHEREPFSDGCYSDFGGDSARDFIYGALPRPRSPDDHYLLYYDLMKWKKGEPVSSAVAVGEDELALVNCLYDSGIAYADSQIDRLLSELEESGVLEDTLVVVTSDHGESLGEKGLFKHANLFENNLMIPLVFGFPGGQYGGQDFDHQVGTIDIVPTVLDYLGIENRSRIDGESLLPIVRREGEPHRPEAWSYAAYENRGVSLRIDNQVKYIYNNTAMSSSRGNEELFNLADDPGELENLAPDDPVAAKGLHDRVMSFYESKTTSTRVVVHNRECGIVEGTIRSKGLMTQLKTFDSAHVGIEPVTENKIKIEVLRDRRMVLFLESTDSMDIEITASGCSPDKPTSAVQRSIGSGGVNRKMYFGLTDLGWQDFADEDLFHRGAPAAGVTIDALDEPEEGESDVLTEDAVLDQLRSLGYVQ